MSDEGSSRRYQYFAIGLVACSTLIHEILLTRICALRLYHHFTFLVISNCLLGMGASGTLLTLYQDRWKPNQRRWLGIFVGAYAASLVFTYVFLLKFPIPAELSLGSDEHLLRFAVFNLAGAFPFFFGGTVIGMLLTFNPDRVNRLYGTDLCGAGIGCIACPALLPLVGAGGVFVVTVLLAIAALVAIGYQRFRVPALVGGALTAAAGAWLVPNLDEQFPVPAKGYVDYLRALEKLEGDPRPPYSVWTANSRIDLFSPTKEAKNGMFGRGRNVEGLPPHPEFRGISQDATAGTVVINFTNHPQGLELLRRTTYAASVRLKKDPKVFIIGLGGGNDAWTAKIHGASSVKAVELNWPIVEIHKKIMRDYSKNLVEDPRVEIVVGEGRSALMRESDTFDVIQMSGVDTWTALASGAYVLAENYLYTREAIELMYRRLNDGGILQVTRFSETMEALRLLSNMNAALDSVGQSELSKSVLAVSAPDKVMAMLLKKGEFTIEEQRSFVKWANDSGLDLVYVPMYFKDKDPIWAFANAQDKQALIDGFPRDISPTTDDEPYFFNYTKWSDPLAARKYADDLPSLSQGNPFFILTQLGISIVLSALLIVLPLWRRAKMPKKGAGKYLLYFSGLGLGFILVEIAMMQKLTLFLGQPVYSLTVTLFSILVFTGIGALKLVDRFGIGDRRIWYVPAGLAALSFLFVVGAAPLLDAMITLPLAVRIVITALLLAPFGLLLGIPFAYGLRVLSERNPALLPWAWAVNGCLSVIGSVLTVVISMNAGFNAVLATAVCIYAVAFWALWSEIGPSLTRATE